MKYRKKNLLSALAVILMVLLYTVTVQAAEYFTTDGGVSVIPVFANTGAADTAMGTPVQGALIYSTSDGGIMYYDGSAWVSIENLDDGTAANNTLRWNGSDWVESTALTNDGTDITATGDVAVNGGDITTTSTTANIVNATATTVNIAGAGTTVEIGAASGTTSVNNNLTVDGNTTIGNASGDTVTANAAAWTFANDTFVTLSGGVNGLNFDSNTLSIDADNNRIGIGTTSPTQALEIDNGDVLIQGSGSYDAAGEQANLYLGDTGAYVRAENGFGLKFGVWNAADAMVLAQSTGRVGIGTAAPGVTLDISAANDALDLPEGTTAQRPGTPAVGMIRYNSTTNAFEGYSGSTPAWVSLANALWEDGANGVYEDDEGVIVGADAAESITNTGFALAAGDLFVSDELGVEGDVFTDGDVDIAGGDLTTANTTATLFNTTATTVNIAGAGTSVEIGAASGNTSVNNNLTVDGNTTIGNASGDTVTVNADFWTFANDTDVALSGGTDGLSFDSDTLSIDAANDRVGIGDITPDGKLEVRNSATEDILNLYDGATNVLSVLDGGDMWVDTDTLYVDASADSVGIGTTSPSANLHVMGTAIFNNGANDWTDVRIEATGAGTFNTITFDNTTDNDWWNIRVQDDVGFVIMNSGGTGVQLNDGATTWSGFSDRRLKTNIETLSVLDKLTNYRAVEYDWIYGDGGHDVGVIAQELYELFPDIVDKGTYEDGLVESMSDNDAWSVEYSKLAPLALQGVKEVDEKYEIQIQELRVENEALKAEKDSEIQELSKQVNQLRAENEALKAEVSKVKVLQEKQAELEARIGQFENYKP